MSRIRGFSPNQWVLATQPRLPEPLMTDDEDIDYLPFRDVPEDANSKFVKTVQVRDAAWRAFARTDTDTRLRRAQAGASRSNHLTCDAGELFWHRRENVGWVPGLATIVSQ
eukprot:13629646-Alexandrium_andersonii.AAC.1